ncbi:MAG TPA: cytochrome b/b6 domain-containing protein [Bosea sp. (in: a-proteobacteria)]
MAGNTNLSSARGSYDGVAKALHWGIAGLIVLAFTLGLLIDAFPRTWKYMAVESHKAIGLAILLLLALRLAWRATHRPPVPAEASPWLNRAARLGHAGLYALMVAAPAAGLAYMVLRGQGLDLGLFQIPPLAAAWPREVTRPIRELHEWLTYGLIALAALHALAALWHHLIRKDDTLRLMLPGK